MPVEKTVTFYVIIHIKSVLNKGQNHCYYNTFSEKYSYELGKKQWDWDLRIDKIKVRKEKCYDAKKAIKIWDVNVDNIVISKLV